MNRRLVGFFFFWAVPALAAPVRYVVTPGTAQSIRFDARTQTERYGGTTSHVTGAVQIDPQNPTVQPSAHLEVALSTLTTGNGSRDSNMRRSFLETDTYPIAAFTLSRLEAPAVPLVPGRPVSGVAHGLFTLHGVTREITPTVTVTREAGIGRPEALHIVARFVVRLSDYNIRTPRLLFFSVRQEHPVTVDVRAVLPPPHGGEQKSSETR